jgi:hypothetical protein
MGSRPVCLGVKHLKPKSIFLLLWNSYGFVDVGCLLWWEDKSVVYNCCWPLQVQLFSGLNPAGLVAISYHLRFETPPTWRARFPYLYSLGIGWSLGTEFLLLASHNSQGYGEGIWTGHCSLSVNNWLPVLTIDSICSLSTDRIDNTSTTSSIVASCSYRMDHIGNTSS